MKKYKLVNGKPVEISNKEMTIFESQFNSLPFQKELKLRELKSNIFSKLNSGFVTSLGIRVDCNETAISKQGLGLQFYNMQNKVDSDIVEFCDYNNLIHQITFLNYKKLITEVGAYYHSIFKEKWNKRSSIEACKTIEGLNSIEVV